MALPSTTKQQTDAAPLAALRIRRHNQGDCQPETRNGKVRPDLVAGPFHAPPGYNGRHGKLLPDRRR